MRKIRINNNLLTGSMKTETVLSILMATAYKFV